MNTETFAAWIGRRETVQDELAAAQYRAAVATFDDPKLTPSDAALLPPLWHWFYFLPTAPQSQLSEDGHPQRGGFMPPIPLPRRMFAGSRMTFHAPLRLAASAIRDSVIRDVTIKRGKSGTLAFVTVSSTITQDDVVCIEEEQDIVYREPGTAVVAPTPVPFDAAPPASWTRDVIPDPRLLFRFSALTFNAHRIHYDREYAMREEGYPGLVVHGPLNAVLLSNLVRAHTTRPIAQFAFRGMAPVFDTAPYRLLARADGDHVQCEVLAANGTVALTATALLR
ncbi:MAG: MaoC family dehydratase N-terminal domain-containing protein [Gemmatimonadaceae bacterium]|nr:MaoC family dehydratase N-terminal domain-containing protein [Gemmatimonadaceae bacterium]